MRELRQHWMEVQKLLLPLDEVFDSSGAGARHRIWFREYLSANELELSLHTVCDYLAGSRTSIIDDGVLNRIRHLHEVMSIEDDCVEKLSHRTTES